MQTLAFDNGDTMPIIGLGTWKSQPGDVGQAVLDALQAGYRHIDCAHIYGNEAEVGQALAEAIATGVVSREELWVTSKLWNNAHAPEEVAPALRQTLAHLGLDYLDLYLIHWPVAQKKEAIFPSSGEDLLPLEAQPVAATWAAMEALVDTSLTRHIGVSNFSTHKLATLLEQSRIKPAMNQIELHPYLQQNAMLAFCREQGIHLTAYSPLGSFDRPDTLKAADEPVLLQDPVIAEIAERHQASPAQVLLRWAVQRGTAVIPKSVNPERLRQNLAAAELILDDQDMSRIATLDRHRRYVSGANWARKGSPYTLSNLWDE